MESVWLKIYVVCVLRSKKGGQRYVGCARNVGKRLRKHNSGQVRSIKTRRPLEFVYKEDDAGWSSAQKREDFLSVVKAAKGLTNKVFRRGVRVV